MARHLARINVGDRVSISHDCYGDRVIGGDPGIRHDTPVTVDKVTQCAAGQLLTAVRCDGTPMEWIENGLEVIEPRTAGTP